MGGNVSLVKVGTTSEERKALLKNAGFSEQIADLCADGYEEVDLTLESVKASPVKIVNRPA